MPWSRRLRTPAQPLKGMADGRSVLATCSIGTSPCEECSSNPWKYKCPGCSTRTCSLPCVNSHKLRTNCDGKRRRTDFVPLSHFDDNLFLSDYNFLEEAKNAAESAQKMRLAVCGNVRFKLPFRLQLLRKAAGRRRARLLILSNGMSRREKNQSRFDQKKNSIFWTVEWQFHSVKVTLIDHGVDEHVELSSVIGKHLQHGPFNSRLGPYSKEQLDHLKYFMKKNPKGPITAYREIDISAPICHQLNGIVVVEYPTIYVHLPSDRYDFEVESVVIQRSEPVEHAENLPSPKGVPFREEEIEEEQDISFDSEVLDLMNDINPGHLDTIPIPEKEHEKHTKPEAKVGHETSVLLDNDGHLNSNLKGFGVDDTTFEFQQDLREAYSGLFGEMNPDDFLCMDGYFSPEDLEEGEILE